VFRIETSTNGWSNTTGTKAFGQSARLAAGKIADRGDAGGELAHQGSQPSRIDRGVALVDAPVPRTSFQLDSRSNPISMPELSHFRLLTHALQEKRVSSS
jgi:hypothetical protein